MPAPPTGDPVELYESSDRTDYRWIGAGSGAFIGASLPLFSDGILGSGCESCPYFIFVPLTALGGLILGLAAGEMANDWKGQGDEEE